MIIIGEKINGAIPSIKQAISERNEALIVERTLAQAKAGANFLDCAPSTATEIEYETMLWLIGLIVKYRDRKETERGRARSFAPFVIGTIALCLVFFVAIPLAIYIACYIPYVTPDGELTLENLLKTFWTVSLAQKKL